MKKMVDYSSKSNDGPARYHAFQKNKNAFIPVKSSFGCKNKDCEQNS